MIRVYSYGKCSTCRKALAWLADRDVVHEVVEIKEMRPSVEELRVMMAAKDGDLRKLFNTSGMDYRALNIKEQLSTMSEEEVFALLQENGMLVKRPFVIGGGVALTGFREAEWQESFG